MKRVSIVIAILISQLSFSQVLQQKLNSAVSKMEKDSQFHHATIGLYITDLNGKVIYNKNGETGMAPASTQKVITSVTAFEILGNDFQYKTTVSADEKVSEGVIDGNLYVLGFGDPTLGSWRWKETRGDVLLSKILRVLLENSVKRITGGIYIDSKYPYPTIPDGWIWQDIGNYYGAGAGGFNWHENQYDLHLRSYEPGTATKVISTTPFDVAHRILNNIIAGKNGSGDNAYLYAAPYDEKIFATGTISPNEKDFVISGSVPDPPAEFSKILSGYLKANNIQVSDTIQIIRKEAGGAQIASYSGYSFATLLSPTFDSMNFWFMRKSINLYGEAFVKSIALQSKKKPSTDDGVEVIRDFWQKNGIAKAALKIKDGSGLSPANRITPKALVQILNFAKNKKWYSSFYHSLPVYNGIKMKSGTIGGVKSFTGYIKSSTGQEYIFAFLINNFDGSAGTVVEKMYKVLDLLK